jgi:hypothetical protein
MAPILRQLLCLWTGIVLLAWPALLPAEEYSGKSLFTETKTQDSGGITLSLAEGTPKLRLAGAFARKSGNYYAAKISADSRTLTWQHLPVDIYDLVLASEQTFYEGLRLARQPDAALAEAERPAITKEVTAIEGFFDHKRVERLEIEGEVAMTLVQQWRSGVALKQSGDQVKGYIHSYDVIWFERPVKGWQLLKRRQLYRAELDRVEPISHRFVVNAVGPISLSD